MVDQGAGVLSDEPGPVAGEVDAVFLPDLTALGAHGLELGVFPAGGGQHSRREQQLEASVAPESRR